MDPTQVQRLKLNINNIKSVLTESTGDLKDAKKKKRAVIRAKIDEEKRLAAEKKLEKKSSPLASIGKTIGKAAGSVKDAFGKVIEFGALVLFGSLVSKLPAFEEQWKEFVEKYKPMFEKIGEFLVGIREAVTGMIDAFVAEPFADNDFAEFDENNKLIDGKLKEIDDAIIGIQKIFDEIGITDLAKKLLGFKDRTPDSVINAGENSLKEALLEQNPNYQSGDIKKKLSGNSVGNNGGSNINVSSTANWKDMNVDELSSTIAERESKGDSSDELRLMKEHLVALKEKKRLTAMFTNPNLLGENKTLYTTSTGKNFDFSDAFSIGSEDTFKSFNFSNVRNYDMLNNSAFTDDSVTVYVGTQVVEKIVPVA